MPSIYKNFLIHWTIFSSSKTFYWITEKLSSINHLKHRNNKNFLVHKKLRHKRLKSHFSFKFAKKIHSEKYYLTMCSYWIIALHFSFDYVKKFLSVLSFFLRQNAYSSHYLLFSSFCSYLKKMEIIRQKNHRD